MSVPMVMSPKRRSNGEISITEERILDGRPSEWLHTYPLRSALLRTGAMACDMSPNRGAIHDAGKVRRAVA